MSLITTAFAPMIQLFPIDIGPRIFAPAPIVTSSPIIGWLWLSSFFLPAAPPIVTHCKIEQFFPNLCCFYPQGEGYKSYE